MIPYTYAGTPTLILPFMPDWGQGVKGSFQTLVKVDAGLSGREGRLAMAGKTRAMMRYSALLNTAEAAEFRTGIAAWANQPILIPFWPSEMLLSASLLIDSSGVDLTDSSGNNLEGSLSAAAGPAVDGALRIYYEPDWSKYEVTTGLPVTFTPSAACLVSPVLWGRFTSKMPEAVVVTGSDFETVDFDLTENGSAAFALSPVAVLLSNGTPVNGFPVPWLNIPFHWEQNKSQGDVVIKRSVVGFGRADADSFYPQSVRKINTLDFQALTAADIKYLLSLFVQTQGSVGNLWVQPPHSANPTDLVYGRFFTEKIELDWVLPARAGELASCEIEFVTLPTEQSVPVGETFADSIGPLPAMFWCYAITDGTLNWFWTSYESAIVGPAALGNATPTYQPMQISHGTITDEINLQQSDCKLALQYFAGSPFNRLRNSLSLPNLTVTIFEGDVANPTAAIALFTGYAQAPKTKGKKWEVTLRGLGSKMDTKGPHLLLQQTCLASFCDQRCKLSAATFQVTLTLGSVTGAVLTFNTATSSTPGRYANGSAVRTLGDGSQQSYMIHDSSWAGGVLSLWLASPLQPAFTGAEAGWVLTPGCDGQLSSCEFYNNTVNFRGFPYLPAQDPSIPAASTTPASGKKG